MRYIQPKGVRERCIPQENRYKTTLKYLSTDRWEMHLGEALEGIRKEKKLTQWVVAQRADISQAYMSQIELGKKKPHLDVLFTICKVLEVDIAIVFLKVLLESRMPNRKLTIGQLESAMKVMQSVLYQEGIMKTLK